MSAPQLNPSFDANAFLESNWQQKPALIKNFCGEFDEPLDAEELAGLALEAGIESRLVTSKGADSYTLRHSPFQEQDFLDLPERDWTLLVQAVDLWVPAVAELKNLFSFLPDWRIDDVMVSHAVPGGGVGPHFDQYDVFLLQGAGKRTWKLGGLCSQEALQVLDSGLKLLKEFDAEQEVTVEYGDVLYIPPGYGHWGTAIEPGLCYSIGFRAPSHGELLETLSDLAIEQQSNFSRYRDEQAQAPRYSSEINASQLEQLWQRLREELNQQQHFYRAFGSLVTTPRYADLFIPTDPPLSPGKLASLRQANSPLLRHSASRFAWLQPEDGNLLVFVDGEAYEQPRANIEAVIALCDTSTESVDDIVPVDKAAWQGLLLALVNQGSLILAEAG